MKKGIFSFAARTVLSLFVLSTVSNSALAITVQLQRARGFSVLEREKLDRALLLVEKVLNSDEFRNEVVNFKNYNDQFEFHQNGGRSNQQVYETIMTAAEQFPKVTDPDQQMNLDLKVYVPKWYDLQGQNVIGYTAPTYMTIYMNRKFYRNYSEANVVGNLVHEWTHKLGFDHDFNYNSKRDFTVPYAVGYIAEKIAKKMSDQH